MVEEGGGVGITCNGGDSSQTEIQYPVNSRQPSPCQTNSQKQRHIPAGCRHSGRTDDKVLGDCDRRRSQRNMLIPRNTEQRLC